jgi:hypothetical protein
MPQITGVTANPQTVNRGETSTVTVVASDDIVEVVARVKQPDGSLGTPQQATVSVKPQFVTDPALATEGDVLVSVSQGVLEETPTPGVFSVRLD